MTELKRLFFAAEIVAAWPQEFSPARILTEEDRHITLVFLGSESPQKLLHDIQKIPQPSFQIGPGGILKEWIFLPHAEEARVVAGRLDFLSDDTPLYDYQHKLAEALQKKESRPFFPHITIGRGPIDVTAWNQFPCQLPFYISSIVLNESLGHSHYQPLWSSPLMAPFEEIEHTADIAFIIRGVTLRDLWLHAQLAMGFKSPPVVPYISKKGEVKTLDEVIQALNALVGKIDQEIGSPFKAVSYHATLKNQNNHLEWTMIIDV